MLPASAEFLDSPGSGGPKFVGANRLSRFLSVRWPLCRSFGASSSAYPVSRRRGRERAMPESENLAPQFGYDDESESRTTSPGPPAGAARLPTGAATSSSPGCHATASVHSRRPRAASRRRRGRGRARGAARVRHRPSPSRRGRAAARRVRARGRPSRPTEEREPRRSAAARAGVRARWPSRPATCPSAGRVPGRRTVVIGRTGRPESLHPEVPSRPAAPAARRAPRLSASAGGRSASWPGCSRSASS